MGEKCQTTVQTTAIIIIKQTNKQRNHEDITWMATSRSSPFRTPEYIIRVDIDLSI